MNIIEKLGITPGPWGWKNHNGLDSIALYSGDNIVIDDGSAYDEYNPKIDVNGSDAKLIAAAPEMLIWIYGMLKCADDYDMGKAAQLLELGPELIQKATGKTWDEVRKLK